MESYLPVYLWKQAIRKEGKDCFDEMLALLKKYPDIFAQQEKDDDDGEVSKVVRLIKVHV